MAHFGVAVKALEPSWMLVSQSQDPMSSRGWFSFLNYYNEAPKTAVLAIGIKSAVG